VRVTLIHNPGAGRQEHDGAAKLIRLLQDEGHQVRAQSAAESGWKQALDAPADLVAVAGGDGTVARVAKAMAGRGIPVAPLPAGTANNIARALGLIERPWEELVRAWSGARRVRLDVGKARGPWGEKYFIEGVGAGLFACLLGSSDPARKLAQTKQPNERVALALEILKRQAADCVPVEIEGDIDGEGFSGRYLLAEVVNLMYVGPSLFLAPDSRPGDGTFDAVVVREAERDRLLNYLASWQENRERLSVLPTRRGKRLRMQWTGFELHIDDELLPGGEHAPVELSVGELSVEMLAPDGKETRR
jgi:diacylglycerol kinase family enzyme